MQPVLSAARSLWIWHAKAAAPLARLPCTVRHCFSGTPLTHNRPALAQSARNTIWVYLRSRSDPRGPASLARTRSTLPAAVAAAGAALLLVIPRALSGHCHASRPPAINHGGAPIAPAGPRTLSHRLRVLQRTLWLLCLLIPLAATFPITSLHPALRTLWLHALSGSLFWCGPAFTKWGQWAAGRPDLLPADVRQVLETLHTAAATHSAAASATAVRQSLGDELGDVFASFEAAPIASGAIAQVHRARLSAHGAALCRRQPGEVRRPPLRSSSPSWRYLVCSCVVPLFSTKNRVQLRGRL